jgi:hypothetical protein
MTALLPLDPRGHPWRLVRRHPRRIEQVAFNEPANVLRPVQAAQRGRRVHRVLELGRDRERENDVRLLWLRFTGRLFHFGLT